MLVFVAEECECPINVDRARYVSKEPLQATVFMSYFASRKLVKQGLTLPGLVQRTVSICGSRIWVVFKSDKNLERRANVSVQGCGVCVCDKKKLFDPDRNRAERAKRFSEK